MVATRGTRLAALALAPRLAGMAELVQITDKVHLARGHAVNWVLVTDDTGVLLIDAGYPGDRAEVLASLNKLGYTPGDVRAIVLTHAHTSTTWARQSGLLVSTARRCTATPRR